MPSMKINLLAMASVVAAVPHYPGHQKFHNRHESAKPYPAGGWSGYNSTAPAYPTGTGAPQTTIDVTSTSTSTLTKTVVVRPSASNPAAVAQGVAPPSDAQNAAPVAGAQNAAPASGDQCGPATVTVTASEKVTVTVTPGGGAGAPQSSAAVPAQSFDNGYGAASSTVAAPVIPAAPSAPAVPAAPAAPSSSKVEEATTTTSQVAQQPSPVVPVPAPSAPEVSSVVNQPPASSAVASSVVASSAAPTPSSGLGNGYSGAKRGLAYNEASLCKTFGSNFGFGYNWGQVENNDIGTNFIPMMHGPDKSSPQEWLANVDKAAKKGSKAVMGFNECDHPAQCNLSPEAACASWKQYMNPITSISTIIGPSVTNSGTPGQGLDWLSKFHQVCPDAVVHATNIHFYDIYDNGTIDRFKAHVEKAAALYGKPVWVTEFGLNPGSASQEQAASFLKDCMSYLDSSDKVQGYSWFMVGTGENQLISGTSLSPVGQVYASH